MKLHSSARIGVSVGSGCIVAVCVRDGRVSAASTAEFARSDELAGAMLRSLREVSAALRWTRAEVHVALEPSLVQVCSLPDVPAIVDAERRHDLAVLSRSSHFLGRPAEMAVCVGDHDSSGALWAMCTDAQTVSRIADAVASARLPLKRFVPSMDVLAAASDGDSAQLTRQDGPTVVGHCTVEDGRVGRVWRALTVAGEPSSPLPVPAEFRRMMGSVVPEPEVPRYVAALAAAVPLERSRFRSPTMFSVSKRPHVRGRLPALFGVAAVLTGIAYALPGLLAYRQAESTATDVALAFPSYRSAAERRLRLDSLAALYDAVERFKAVSAPSLRLMSAIGDALPDDGVVSSITVDSVSAHVTLLVPSATEVANRLASNASLDSVAFAGAITRERVSAQPPMLASGSGYAGSAGPQEEIERAAIRVFASRAQPRIRRAEPIPRRPADVRLLAQRLDTTQVKE